MPQVVQFQTRRPRLCLLQLALLVRQLEGAPPAEPFAPRPAAGHVLQVRAEGRPSKPSPLAILSVKGTASVCGPRNSKRDSCECTSNTCGVEVAAHHLMYVIDTHMDRPL